MNELTDNLARIVFRFFFLVSSAVVFGAWAMFLFLATHGGSAAGVLLPLLLVFTAYGAVVYSVVPALAYSLLVELWWFPAVPGSFRLFVIYSAACGAVAGIWLGYLIEIRTAREYLGFAIGGCCSGLITAMVEMCVAAMRRKGRTSR